MPEAVDATVFEGARLIIGDGSEPIEDAAFVVQNGRFTQVGPRGQINAPAGAERVDLSGKTVMPAIVDAHKHAAGDREALVDQLQRMAYYGIGVAMSMGTDDGDLASQVREETIPNAARLRTAGRGITRPEEGRSEVPYWVTSEDEARTAVQELAARQVDMVKIWVDDRGGTVPKLGPEVYRAIIDEAHARGMRVASHLGSTSGLADAKDLIRAGIDGFAHTVRDRDIDDEYMALVREHPDVWTIPNLPGSPVTLDDLPWLGETLPPFEIENLRAQAEQLAVEGPGESFELQCRNLARNREAGMMIGMGTDSGVSVAWTTHTELRDMASCGLTPMEAIESATRINAEILGLDDLGTVTEGKSASFVVLEADPLDDVENTRRIDSVYLRGEAVNREALRAKFMDGVR
jgi:imidazolonepropionase-like amidohydrolase